MNVRFNYLYRDAGNYKAYGEVIFDGTGCVSVVQAEAELGRSLIEGEYFVARDVAVPDLRPSVLNSTIDHDWHEVEGLEECGDPPNDHLGRSINEFIEALELACAGALAKAVDHH